MAVAQSAATAVQDAENANNKEDGSANDADAPFEVVLAPVVDLDLDFDDTLEPEDVAATIAFAVNGLMEAMLLPIVVDSENVMNAPDMTFTRDREPIAPPLDRHGPKRATKKARQKKSAALKSGSMHGESRAPSRASSRAASRFGGSIRALTTAMRSVGMASKLSRTAIEPCQVVPWQDGPSSREQTPGVHALWREEQGGAASLAGSTARRRVDAAEIQRRGDIERDISTREARRQLSRQIQRKGELPLKLRSLDDPEVSFDTQEALAATAARTGVGSRLGGSRLGDRPKSPAMGLPLASLVKSEPASSGFSEPTRNDRDPSTTFRSEDYREISSSLVLLGRGGEVLVGDNCYLVGRKPRLEIAQDLSKKAKVEPRISVVAPPSDTDSQATAAEPATPIQESASRSIGKGPLPAVSATKAGDETYDCVRRQTQVNPAFEGCLGSVETYPRLEMDSSTTALAKGVTVKGDEQSALFPAGSPKPRHARIVDKAPLSSRPRHVAVMKTTEEPTSPTISNPPEPQQESAPVADKTAKVLSLEKNADALHRAVMLKNRETHLHSLRIRTPAQERRPPASKQSRSRFGLAQLEENAAADAMEHRTSDEPTNMSVRSLRTKYMREFPIPPSGTIRVFKAAALSRYDATDAIPFGALPSIVKAKR